MIIFDLDGTLADCEHRRHFVDAYHPYHKGKYSPNSNSGWQPNWPAFYEACDLDKPIEPVIKVLQSFAINGRNEIAIWSGRCESVKEKTLKWLNTNIKINRPICSADHYLKMRPIGDSTPDDILKECWLNERCADLITAQIEGINPSRHDIELVFDDRPKVVRMWRRRGIFVFNCAQNENEF